LSPVITVREYARLTTSDVALPSLDRRQISASAFDWLCKLSGLFNRSGARLVQLADRRWLQLENYVGVVETPCGTRLEILPKHMEDDDSVEYGRSLMLRMMTSALELPTREVGEAQLELLGVPLSEWVIARFLNSLDRLVKRGVSFQYKRIEEEQRFLRGQLDLVRQVRERPERQHYFQIRHDIFSPDRAENRLLRLALERACKVTQIPANWRLAHELRALFQDIPASQDVVGDFGKWHNDRLLSHYRQTKPWCELILSQQMPAAVSGEWRGISMLFPMEKLFERYVEACLRNSLAEGADLRTQPNSHYLCKHSGSRMFRLQPDMVLDKGPDRWVLDTKWKLLDATDRKNNYGLKQSDFYQLFAYGNKYLCGHDGGALAVIYPKRGSFSEALPPFYFSKELPLWVLPFNLENGCLEYPEVLNLPLRSRVSLS
jgi:5-methylcytosine-specific restriction endonuclease McrBC regulatory subunit McrC